jgi:hypothetical protein
MAYPGSTHACGRRDRPMNIEADPSLRVTRAGKRRLTADLGLIPSLSPTLV